ncbi:MAG: GntR family transcriptional regulator [Planctomycetota bacterium]|jgi:DNA-binding transcriptional regulator YhcF (GntR family)
MNIREEMRNWLIAGMKAGDFPPGSPLPSRHDLMDRFGAARATVDKVIRELAQEEWVVSRKGAGTFVADTPAAERCAFLVQAPPHFIEALCRRLNGKLNYEVLQSDEVIQAFPRMATRESRIIWHTPNQANHYFIDQFERAGVPQLLINRRHERVSYITTDTQAGLEYGVASLCQDHPRATWGALLPPLAPGSYFLAEREIFFYEALARRGKATKVSMRAAADSTEEHWKAIDRLLEHRPRPRIVFCPHITMLRPLLTLIRERGITLGKDLFLLTTDRDHSMTDLPGVLALEQDWRAMAIEAASWLRTGRPPHLESVVPHRNIGIGNWELGA